MAKKRFAIIAALEFEERLLRDALCGMEERTLLRVPVFVGIIGENDVVVARCGMGKVSAAICTQAIIDEFKPDYVINTGCAGAISPELGIGDVVIADSVVEWDIDLRPIGYPRGYVDAIGAVEMKASAELCEMIRSVSLDGERVTVGMVASGDQFVASNEMRSAILNDFPRALCSEMEGAAVGQTCFQNGVPFCVLRTMSDTADGNGGVDFAKFSVEASHKSADRLVRLLEKF